MSESNLPSTKNPEPPRRIVPVALVPVIVAGAIGLFYVIGRDTGRRGPDATPSDGPPGALTRAESRSLERPGPGPLTGLHPVKVRPLADLQPRRIPLPISPIALPTGTAAPVKTPVSPTATGGGG